MGKKLTSQFFPRGKNGPAHSFPGEKTDWGEIPACYTGVGVAQVLKFLVKVFRSLYLLKLKMDQVDTLHVGRYWSKVLCCNITTHLGDLEVKVTDLEILC